MMTDAILSRAFAAYFRTAKREGYLADQPASHSSVLTHNGKGYVVLINGIWDVLAVYRIRNDDTLKRLHHWPAELGHTLTHLVGR